MQVLSLPVTVLTLGIDGGEHAHALHRLAGQRHLPGGLRHRFGSAFVASIVIRIRVVPYECLVVKRLDASRPESRKACEVELAGLRRCGVRVFRRAGNMLIGWRSQSAREVRRRDRGHRRERRVLRTRALEIAARSGATASRSASQDLRRLASCRNANVQSCRFRARRRPWRVSRQAAEGLALVRLERGNHLLDVLVHVQLFQGCGQCRAKRKAARSCSMADSASASTSPVGDSNTSRP